MFFWQNVKTEGGKEKFLKKINMHLKILKWETNTNYKTTINRIR